MVADLGGGSGERSPPTVDVGGTESLISPQINHEYKNKMPQSPPTVAVVGTGGDGPTESLKENFHLHPPLSREEHPPNI